MVKDKKKFCTMRQTEKMVKNVFGIRGFKGTSSERSSAKSN